MPRLRQGWRVYLLRCADGTLYTGATNDLPRRLARHAAGAGARYTRSRLPVALVLEIPCRGRGAALRREAAVKAMTRAEKLSLVARGRRRLARSPEPEAGRPSAPYALAPGPSPPGNLTSASLSRT